MLLTPGRKRLSVEIEPPKLSSKEASTEEFLEKIRTLSEFSDLVSITNRHTFHMATLTAIKKALTVLRQLTVLQSIGLLMHLTTRVSAIETYKLLQDARDVGVEHFLPLMGDPRGPVAAGFFKNSLDLLRFVSFLSTGEKKFLEQIKDLNYLMDEPPPPIEKNNFQVGTVVDPNPTRWVVNREVEIREKEIKLVDLKVQAGATYFISQAFFLADYFFDFLDNLTEPVEIGAGLIPARLPLTKRIGVPMPFEARKCLQSAVLPPFQN